MSKKKRKKKIHRENAPQGPQNRPSEPETVQDEPAPVQPAYRAQKLSTRDINVGDMLIGFDDRIHIVGRGQEGAWFTARCGQGLHVSRLLKPLEPFGEMCPSCTSPVWDEGYQIKRISPHAPSQRKSWIGRLFGSS